MKAYLIYSSHASNKYYDSDSFCLCLDSKVHMKYGVWMSSSLHHQAGTLDYNEFTSTFWPCDDKHCIGSLFSQTGFVERHPLTPEVLPFLREALRSEARTEVPVPLVPYLERILAGEDIKAVDRSLRQATRHR